MSPRVAAALIRALDAEKGIAPAIHYLAFGPAVATIIDSKSNHRTPYQEHGAAPNFSIRAPSRQGDRCAPAEKARVVVSDGRPTSPDGRSAIFRFPDQRGLVHSYSPFNRSVLGLAAAIGARGDATATGWWSWPAGRRAVS